MLAKLTTLVKRPFVLAERPSAAELIVEPPVAARVVALPDGRFHVSWQPQAETVQIFALAQPEMGHVSRQWVATAVGQETAVRLPAAWPRPYFALEFSGGPADGRCLLTAERRLALAGTLNFRDVGGYGTSDGRVVRWGQVYRSGSLAGLQDADVAYLQALGIRMVCDLRSPREMERAPDRLPGEGVAQLLRPLTSQETGREQMRVLHQYRHDMAGLLLRVYTKVMVDQNAAAIGEMLTRLAAAENRPALFHCAVGKDRTGVVIALLLALLGVPEATILADYSLSNADYEAIRRAMAPELRQALWLGIRPSRLRPLELADPQILQAAFAHIRQTYGSVETYLHEAAGVSPETAARLRADLLVGEEGD